MIRTFSPLLLLLLYLISYLLPLNSRDLWIPDETRYAEISREMLTSGNLIVPQLLGMDYFEKPIAGYWIDALAQALFGTSPLAVRAGSVLSVTLCAILIYRFCRREWHSSHSAMLAALIYLSCFLVYAIGTYSLLDPMLALWLCAAMLALWQACEATSRAGKAVGYLWLGLACGMGVMTKGLLALLLPALSLLPWLIFTRRWRDVLMYGPLAVLSALVILLPWSLAIAWQAPDFWRYFFWVEHIQRFAGDNAQHRSPIWYYLPFLLTGALPWAGLIPAALGYGWQQRHRQPVTLYLLGWVVMPLLFFSLTRGKLPTYLLPCFAPLAILMAISARHGFSLLSLKLNGIINLMFGLLGSIALVVSCYVPALTLYSPQESYKVLLLLLAFAGWAVAGALTLRTPRRLWPLSAGCPLLLALVAGYVIPDTVRDAKQPRSFLETIEVPLSASRYIIATNPGLATAAGWYAERSDISLYGSPGELAYGLNKPQAQGRLVVAQEFTSWLQARRQQGVALLILLPRPPATPPTPWPQPDYRYRQGRFLLLWYGPRR